MVLRTHAPGRAPFHPDARRSLLYRVLRGGLWVFMALWFRPVVVGREKVPPSGPVLIAPVHRSFIDFGFAGFVTSRKLFFMAKEELWHSRLLGWVLERLGVFPVNRSGTDRDALYRAEEVLRRGLVLVMFPEGTRQAGATVKEILEGAAFVALRTGATIVPLGIGGSDRAMPKGSVFPRPTRVRVVVGDPLVPSSSRGLGREAPGGTESPRRQAHDPTGSGSKTLTRTPRREVHRLTEELRARIQAAYDAARA